MLGDRLHRGKERTESKWDERPQEGQETVCNGPWSMSSGQDPVPKTIKTKSSLSIQWYICVSAPSPRLHLPISLYGGLGVRLPGWAAGSTSDTYDDKRETPDCRGEGSHPWHRSAGFRLFMVGTNYRSTDSPSPKNSSWYKENIKLV
ncbi:hypothetical protein Q8A73_004319 [Channa argus]|nr:hypothetical protein Q8A73_004319 [Channa argus]